MSEPPEFDDLLLVWIALMIIALGGACLIMWLFPLPVY